MRSDALGVGEPLDANERRALQLLEDDMPIEDTIMFRKSVRRGLSSEIEATARERLQV